MNKVIITISLLSGLSCFQDGTRVDYVEISKWNEVINNVQDMKEWLKYDINQSVIDSVHADYYFEYLNRTEDLLIELYNEKEN